MLPSHVRPDGWGVACPGSLALTRSADVNVHQHSPVVLSGVLVFMLGYFAGWRHAKGGNNGANPHQLQRILPGPQD